MNPSANQRRGTVYVVVLAVLSIVITVSLSGLTNARSEMAAASNSADETTARSIAQSAMEAAFEIIGSDPDWRSSISGGLLIPKAAMGSGIFRIEVSDPSDGDPVDDYADPFELTAIAEYGTARQMYRYRFEYAPSHTMSPDTVLKHHPIAYWPLWGLLGDKSPDLRELREAQLQGKIQYDAQDPTGVYDMPTLHSTNQTWFEVNHEPQMELDYGSFSVWFQPSAMYASSGTIQVVSSKHVHDEEDAVQFSIICANGQVGLLLDYDESLTLQPIGSIQGDTWHHVAVTWGASGWSTYLNGKPTGSTNRPLGLGVAWTSKPNVEKLRFGAAKGLLGRQASSDIGNYFHGKICEAAMFAYELSPAQVEELASIPPTPRPMLIDHQSVTRVVD